MHAIQNLSSDLSTSPCTSSGGGIIKDLIFARLRIPIGLSSTHQGTEVSHVDWGRNINTRSRNRLSTPSASKDRTSRLLGNYLRVSPCKVLLLSLTF